MTRRRLSDGRVVRDPELYFAAQMVPPMRALSKHYNQSTQRRALVYLVERFFGEERAAKVREALR